MIKLKDILLEGKRIPRKKGQKRQSSKHSDLYTDENPKGTIHGLKFATVKDAEASINKIKSSGRKHAHKVQAAVAMEQRAKAAGKKSAAAVYRKYINSVKKNEVDYHSKLSRGHKPDYYQLGTAEFKPFDKSRDDVEENVAPNHDGKAAPYGSGYEPTDESLFESKYNSWVMPNKQMLAREFRVEHEKKGRQDFTSEQDFMQAVQNAQIRKIDKSTDRRIGNRSHTKTFDELHDLIKTYRSYPKYRNEESLRDMYRRFGNNQPMDMPIIFDDNGDLEIFSGNTRMDIAFQMGIEPKAMIININDVNESFDDSMDAWPTGPFGKRGDYGDYGGPYGKGKRSKSDFKKGPGKTPTKGIGHGRGEEEKEDDDITGYTAENFADGKKPGRKGLSKRVGVSQKMSIAQLAKIAKTASGERKRMAQWNLNMKRGRKKK